MKNILQHDERDCGAACLAMIANYYGVKYPLSVFLDCTKTDKNGVNLYGMIDGGEKVGLSGVALSCDYSELMTALKNNTVLFPFVAHITTELGMLHFVVVYKIKNDDLYIADPGKGKYRIKKEHFVELWNGYIISYKKNNHFKKIKKTHHINQISIFFKNQTPKIIFILIFSLFISGIGIAGAYVFQTVIDSFDDSYEEDVHYDDSDSYIYDDGNAIDLLTEKMSHFIDENKKNFNIFFISLFFLYCLQAVIQFLRGYLISLLSREIDIKLVFSYYNHIVDLPILKLTQKNTGEYLSRFSDSVIVRNAISTGILTLILDSIMVIACGIMLYFQNKSLFFVSLFSVIMYGVVICVFRKPIDIYNKKMMENNALVESYLKESIDGAETIKAIQAEQTIKNINKSKFIKLVNIVFKSNLFAYSQDSISSFVEVVSILITLWIGFSMVKSGNISLGELISYYALLSYFTVPIKNLIELQPTVQSAFIAADRLNDIENAKCEDTVDTAENIFFEKLELKNVTFRYGNRDAVLNNISLNAKRGEKIAIVGESGCGKSTLAKLFLRFYDPECGKIYINNKSIDNYTLADTRSIISYVPQKTFLFSDTIKNNLLLGCENIDESNLTEVCRQTNCDTFIDKLPFGYDTFLDENGSNLSGGQKQRLSIARALIKCPQLLILDEATSNLDSYAESLIKKTLFSNPDLTVVMITHRLSTVKECDKIYVMDNGRIIESGKHDDLMKKNGKYTELYNNFN